MTSPLQPDFDREIKGYVGEYLFWTLWRPHLDSGDPRPLAHRIDGDLPPGISLQIEENDENPEDKIPHLQGTFEEAGVWFVHHWVEDAEEEVIYQTLYRISVSSEPDDEMMEDDGEMMEDDDEMMEDDGEIESEPLAFEEGFFVPSVFRVGEPVEFMLPEAVNGIEPLTYSVSGLPPGLSFDPATRTVMGIPTTTDAPEEMAITVTDASGSSVSAAFRIEVEENTFTYDAFVGPLFRLTYDPDPGETISFSGLPSWLEFDSTTNVLSGTPLSAGRYTFRQTDSDGGWFSYLIVVHEQLSDRRIETKVLGQSFHESHEKSFPGGTAPFTMRIEGTLPPGVSFYQTEEYAALRGAPEETGTFDFEFVTTDANGMGRWIRFGWLSLNYEEFGQPSLRGGD